MIVLANHVLTVRDDRIHDRLFYSLHRCVEDRLDPIFDVMVISGEVGLRKPDPAIFELTTDRLGVAAGECVFVDDHPGHLQSAAQAGMTTVLHRDPARTIAELEGLLGLVLSGSS